MARLAEASDCFSALKTGWSFAAASDGPPTCSKFSFAMCLRIVVMAKCFVIRSAVLTSSGITFSETILLAHLFYTMRVWWISFTYYVARGIDEG